MPDLFVAGVVLGLALDVTQEQAHAVVGGRSVLQYVGDEQLFHRRALHQRLAAALIEVVMPFEEIVHIGGDVSVGVAHQQHVIGLGHIDAGPVVGFHIARSLPGVGLIHVVRGHGAGHPQRGEDLALQELTEGKPGELADDIPQHHIGGVAVGPAGVRLKVQLGAEAPGDLQKPGGVGGAEGLLILPEALLKVFPDAGGVGHEHPHGDGFPVVGEIREKTLDGLIQIQQAPVPEHEDSHAGELLGVGGDDEIVLRCDGPSPFQVGHAVALAEKHLAVLGQQEGKARGVRPGRFPGDPVRRLFQCLHPAHSRTVSWNQTRPSLVTFTPVMSFLVAMQ